MKTYYPTLDLTKLIMAICVIMIHVSLFQDINQTLYLLTCMGICRIAVPFFFVLTGYFYDINQKLGKNLKHYGILFGQFLFLEGIIFLPQTINDYQRGVFFRYFFRYFTSGFSGALWYLTASMLGFIVLHLFISHSHYFISFFIGLCLWFIGLSMDSYAGFFQFQPFISLAQMHMNIFNLPQAGLLTSLVYMNMGAIIHHYQIDCRYKKIFLVLAVICLELEAYFLNSCAIAYDGNIYISLLFCGPLLFLVVKESKLIRNRNLAKKCGHYSMYFYLLHPSLKHLLTAFSLPTLLRFFIVLFFTYVCSRMLMSLNFYKQNGVIKSSQHFKKTS